MHYPKAHRSLAWDSAGLIVPMVGYKSMHVIFSNAMNVDTGEWEKVPTAAMYYQCRKKDPHTVVQAGVPTGARVDWTRTALLAALMMKLRCRLLYELQRIRSYELTGGAD
jgi:hypothetical protein